MHEYGLVQALIGKVEREAKARGATRVHSVSLSVGEHAALEVELFETAYRTFREKTVCEAAALSIRRAPGTDIVLERLELEVPDV